MLTIHPLVSVSMGTVKPWKQSTPWVERKVCWGSDFQTVDSPWWEWRTKTVKTVGKALSVLKGQVVVGEGVWARIRPPGG